MLSYQCHCQVMQQAWLQAICGFCGFFSVCQQMPELTSHGNCRWPEASSVNTSITNLLIYSRNQRKKRRTMIVGPTLISNSPHDPRKEAQSALFAWFRNTIFREMQGFPMENILISFRELCQKWYCWCVFCASSHTHIYREFPVNPGEGTAMHKNKALSPKELCFCSRTGAWAIPNI